MVLVFALPACATTAPVVAGRHAAEVVLPDEPEALIQMRKQGNLWRVEKDDLLAGLDVGWRGPGRWIAGGFR